MKYYEEKAKQIPIIASVDVPFAGADPAGIGATLMAALSIKENVALRDLDVKKTRAKAGP